GGRGDGGGVGRGPAGAGLRPPGPAARHGGGGDRAPGGGRDRPFRADPRRVAGGSRPALVRPRRDRREPPARDRPPAVIPFADEGLLRRPGSGSPPRRAGWA